VGAGVAGAVLGAGVVLCAAAARSRRFSRRRWARRARSSAACCAVWPVGEEVVEPEGLVALLAPVDLLDEPMLCPATNPTTMIKASASAPTATRLRRCTAGDRGLVS
jgi:hypothetical protein